MKLNKLTARQVETAKKVGKYGDGGGLWLKIRRPGDASWVFSYMVDGRARELGLGARHSVNLAEARELARRSRQMILDGVDPIEERKARIAAQRAEAAKTWTFEKAALDFLAKSKTIKELKSDKHRRQWRSTLEQYAFPVIGKLALQQIDSALVLDVLNPVWARAPETASRLRSRIEKVFAWAIPLKRFKGDNPASLTALKGHLPAKPKQKHHAAMPYGELPAFMARLRMRNGVSAKALEFTILCASRTSEVLGMTRSELDLDAGLWTIPAERMKAGREHVVPLSHRALELLRHSLAMGTPQFGHVFINGNGKPLSNQAMSELLKGMGVKATVHGTARSSFRDWCGDRTGFDRETIELALAHQIGSKTEKAYRRQTAIAKRARLMQQWCDFLQAPAGDAKNVVSMRA
jgi:integrase